MLLLLLFAVVVVVVVVIFYQVVVAGEFFKGLNWSFQVCCCHIIYIFFKGGPATDSFYVLAPLITLLHNFSRQLLLLFFSIHPMAHLKSSSCPVVSRKPFLPLLFDFSNVPLLFHLFKSLVIVSFFKRPFIVIHFFNHRRYCFILSIVLFLFHFLQSSRFCFILSIVPFLFHFINRPN